MEPQANKLGYVVGALVVILLIILFAWLVVGRQKIVSPVPEEGVRVIFVSPTPTLSPSPTATAWPTPKASPKPTPKPTPKPSPTVSPSPTASPTASPSPTP